jgi:hypothetical protein
MRSLALDDQFPGARPTWPVTPRQRVIEPAGAFPVLEVTLDTGQRPTVPGPTTE